MEEITLTETRALVSSSSTVTDSYVSHSCIVSVCLRVLSTSDPRYRPWQRWPSWEDPRQWPWTTCCSFWEETRCAVLPAKKSTARHSLDGMEPVAVLLLMLLLCVCVCVTSSKHRLVGTQWRCVDMGQSKHSISLRCFNSFWKKACMAKAGMCFPLWGSLGSPLPKKEELD